MGFFGGGAAPANMGGATSSVAGTAGLVPAPSAGDQYKFLKGDATFSNGDSAYISPSVTYGSSSSTAPSFCRPLYTLPMGMVNSPCYQNRLQFSWTKLVVPITFSNIIYHVQANNNASGWDLGIYSNDSSLMKPNTLLNSFAGLSCASTGVFDVSVTSTTLAEGDYWICAYTKANTNFSGGVDASAWRQVSHRNGSFGGGVLYWGINSSQSAGNSHMLSWQVLNYSTGSLPSTMSGLTIQTMDQFTPYIGVR